MLQKIKEATEYIQERLKPEADVAIVLGSGLGDFANEIKVIDAIPYSEIPHFPISAVPGHAGRLVYGEVMGRKVLAMQGRFHYYEGYTMQECTIHVRVFCLLGIKELFVSNAAGGLNKDFKVGDLMVIDDHINHFGDNPLRGENLEQFGTRFPAMNDAYTPSLIEKAHRVAKESNITLQQGVYLGTAGPNFETQAELRYFTTIGANAVGMSTVPEVLVARHCGMDVFGVSIITNIAVPELALEASHDEVQDAAKITGPKVKALFEGMLKQYTIF